MENKNVLGIRKWGMVWKKGCQEYQDAKTRVERISLKVILNPLQNELEHGSFIIAMVIPKRILVKVRLEILRRHCMVNARNATLCQRPKTLNTVGMSIPINIDFSTMLDSLMPISGIGNPVIAREFVSIDNGSPSHVSADKRHDSRTFDVGNDRGGDFALPLDYANDGCLAFRTTASFAPPSTAKIGLVNLYFAVKGDSVFAKQSPDLLEHSPCCFVGDTSHSLKLFGRVSRAGSGYPEHGVKPSPQRRGGLMEDSISSRINLMPAIIALIARSALNLVVLSYLVANRTIDTVRPSVVFEPLKAGIIVRKLTLKLCQCVPLKLCLNSIGHFSYPPYTRIITQILRVVKGYLPNILYI
jgi:hypothetical protein